MEEIKEKVRAPLDSKALVPYPTPMLTSDPQLDSVRLHRTARATHLRDKSSIFMVTYLVTTSHTLIYVDTEYPLW